MEIHQQNAPGGTITNVEGDMTIWNGCVVGTAVSTRRHAAGLRHSVARADLDGPDVREELAEIDCALTGDQPDRDRAADALNRLARRLSSAGALAEGGSTLVERVGRLARAIGPPALALLGWLGIA